LSTAGVYGGIKAIEPQNSSRARCETRTIPPAPRPSSVYGAARA